MTMLNDLLSRGYFPRELPPPFSTPAFASCITSALPNLPPSFAATNQPAKLLSHNLARVGGLRRRLGIPNPLLHLNLCREVTQNWHQLHTFTAGSPLSASKPTSLSISDRAIVPSLGQGDLPFLRAQSRTTARYFLRTDISRFYPSVYTHSIPWALHTKPTAKANRGNGLLGNRLDQLIRNAQDGQTIGIPIGPDTSLLIAEVLLTATDTIIIQSLGPVPGFRHVDDYELCFGSLSEAEGALNTIQGILAEYELALNPAKTKIIELPYPLEHTWASELRAYSLRTAPREQRNDLISFFSRAFELSKEHSEDSVLKYAIPRMRSVPIDRANWPLFQALLLQSATAESGTLAYVLNQAA